MFVSRVMSVFKLLVDEQCVKLADFEERSVWHYVTTDTGDSNWFRLSTRSRRRAGMNNQAKFKNHSKFKFKLKIREINDQSH